MTHADTLVRNGPIIDCVTDRPTESAAIWIRGGRVQDCGTEETVRRAAPPDTEEIDLAGAYVMPGLVNMHTHFSLSLPGDGGDRVKALGPHALALHMAAGARETLRSGVTAVRCVAERDHADFALRDADGTVTAAMNLCTYSLRTSPVELVNRGLPLLRKAATAIEAEMRASTQLSV